MEVILDPNTGEVKVYTHKLVNPENGETLDIDEYEVSIQPKAQIELDREK